MNSIDQQFIEYIVKSLVGKPDAVKVDRRIDEKGVLLELIVDPEDLGRVIGKRGATAQSLRTLLRALGTKNDARYNLKIIDTGPPPQRRDDRDDVQPAQDAPAADAPAEEPKTEDTAVEEPIAAPADEPASAPADDVSDVDEEVKIPEKPSAHDDVISQTRKELEELDDLDV
jgi:predicted RNA-binding protein YlqC (UPF0109 family)